MDNQKELDFNSREAQEEKIRLFISNQVFNNNYICLYFEHFNEYTAIRTP